MTTTLSRQHEMARAMGTKMTNLVVVLVLIVQSRPPYSPRGAAELTIALRQRGQVV